MNIRHSYEPLKKRHNISKENQRSIIGMHEYIWKIKLTR